MRSRTIRQIEGVKSQRTAVPQSPPLRKQVNPNTDSRTRAQIFFRLVCCEAGTSALPAPAATRGAGRGAGGAAARAVALCERGRERGEEGRFAGAGAGQRSMEAGAVARRAPAGGVGAAAAATAADTAATTTTITTVLDGGAGPSGSPPETARLTLQLPPRRKKAVSWAGGTVDNEHLGRKSSKKCCIYHKRRAFGESDSDDSDTDPECSCPPGARIGARRAIDSAVEVEAQILRNGGGGGGGGGGSSGGGSEADRGRADGSG